MDKITVKVSGMTCGGCAKSIQNALNGRSGVQGSMADADKGEVEIEFDSAVIQLPALEQAITDAGFDVVA